MHLLQLLKDELFKEHKDRIVAWIGKDKDRFAGLIDLFFNGDNRIAQRAALAAQLLRPEPSPTDHAVLQTDPRQPRPEKYPPRSRAKYHPPAAGRDHPQKIPRTRNE
ncbi:hypothetical protein ACQ86N_17545 [Puia sp. P3]|uniref:hypothetical protein n=1 Tax=Puia sp. P3 TaxID=3423952 RepID=UPI003D67149B